MEGWSIDAAHKTEKLTLVSPALRSATMGFPGPGGGTVSICVAALKVAMALMAPFIVIIHAPVPVHAPDQPAKVDPLAAVAVSTTEVPLV